MPTKKPLKKKVQKPYVFFEFERLNISLRAKKDDESKWTDIGSSNATIDEEYLNLNPQLKKHFAAFAVNLANQLKCDGIEIHGISFSRFNFKNK